MGEFKLCMKQCRNARA